MSRWAMEEIIQRVDTDLSFRELFLKCPGAVLDMYPMAPAEKAALLSGNGQQLEALGIAAAMAGRWTAACAGT